MSENLEGVVYDLEGRIEELETKIEKITALLYERQNFKNGLVERVDDLEKTAKSTKDDLETLEGRVEDLENP